MKLLRDRRGAVTVFLALIFPAFLLVAGVFVDAARVMIAGQMLQTSLDSAVRSAMAGCHERLAAEFGLYGGEMPEEEIERYLRLNLKGRPGALRLLTFHEIRVEKETHVTGSLLNDEILRQQIHEYMQYKGPLIWGEKFLDGWRQGRPGDGIKSLDLGQQAAATALAEETAVNGNASSQQKNSLSPGEDRARQDIPDSLRLDFSFKELPGQDLIGAGTFSAANASSRETEPISLFAGDLAVAPEEGAALQEGRRILEYLDALDKELETVLLQSLDKLYQAEYILDKYTYLTSSTLRNHYLDKGEAEYILVGDNAELSNLLTVFGRILLFRFAVNTMDVFVKNPLPDPLARLVLALTEGFAAASAETVRIYDGQSVPLFPGTSAVTLSYSDYLRLFLVLQDKEIQLNRMRQLMQVNIRQMDQAGDFQLNALTARGIVRAAAEIDLWFLRLQGDRYRLEGETTFSYGS
ncbi:MAG: DUF5702 domain-containing protein [Clostridia bacterium]|nr:DUF5702 domain-containing protein [Clostridia bacterium]